MSEPTDPQVALSWTERDIEQVRATDRVLAAAHDLLAACRQAEQWLTGWASAEPQLAVLRAAIAKAEGRS